MTIDRSGGRSFITVGSSIFWASEDGVRVARADGTLARVFGPKAKAVPAAIDWDGVDLQWLEFSSTTSWLRWGKPEGTATGEMVVGMSSVLAARPEETFLLVDEGDQFGLTGINRGTGATRRFGGLAQSIGGALGANSQWVYACGRSRARLDVASLEFEDRLLNSNCNSLIVTASRVFLGMGPPQPPAVLSWTHGAWNVDGLVVAEIPDEGGTIAGLAVDASCLYLLWSSGGKDGRIYRVVRPK